MHPSCADDEIKPQAPLSLRILLIGAVMGVYGGETSDVLSSIGAEVTSDSPGCFLLSSPVQENALQGETSSLQVLPKKHLNDIIAYWKSFVKGSAMGIIRGWAQMMISAGLVGYRLVGDYFRTILAVNGRPSTARPEAVISLSCSLTSRASSQRAAAWTSPRAAVSMA